MSGRNADQRVVIPLATERWLAVTFVHWRCPARAVQERLPRGLTVDEHDGSAWLSITPFVMSGIRPLGPPFVPDLDRVPAWLRRLQGRPEVRGTNLRTYVRGPDGRDGLWFLSQDTSSIALAVGARGLLGAPYHWGRVGVEERDGVVSYSGARFGSPVSYRLTVRPGAPIDPTERDTWLTGRWRAYTQRAGRLLSTPVDHEPWPLRTATLDRMEQTLTSAADVPGPETPLVHFSDGVHPVRNGLTRPA